MDAPTGVAYGDRGEIVRVGLAYMVYGFAIFVALGILGFLMRIQQAGMANLSSSTFYSIMTFHGIGMVSNALLIAIGGYAVAINKSVKLNTRWLWIIFILYVMGNSFVMLATLVGGFAASWTAMYPLPFFGDWSVWAAVSTTVGLGFMLAGLLMYFLLVLQSSSRTYGGLRKALALKFLFSRGRSSEDILPSPVALLGTAVSIPGVVSVAAGFIWLIPLWVQAAGLVTGVNVLFMKNFDYLFGHLIANLTIYFAAGLLYYLVPVFTKREIRTSWAIVLALNSAIVLLLTAYFHHLYQDFAQPLGFSVFGEIATYFSTLPTLLVTIVGALSEIYHSNIRWTAASVMFALGIWGWVFGGIGGILDATIAVNQVMHNTLWVPGHFHTYLLLGTLTFGLGFLYHLVHKLGQSPEKRWSKFAAFLYGIGGAGFVLMFFVSGALSIPRRLAMYEQDWQLYPSISVLFIVVLGFGVLWLGYGIFIRLRQAWKRTYTDLNVYSVLESADEG